MAETKGKRQGQSSDGATAAAAASIASVLGDDNLLVEILLRLGSPVWLVRGALVRRRWLRLASDLAFLRRFRGLHPPRILGHGVHRFGLSPRFLPVPQPPELAAAARHAGRALEILGCRDWVMDCRNGRLLAQTYSNGKLRYVVRRLLHEAWETILPPPPPGFSKSGSNRLFLLEDDGDSTSCLFLSMKCDNAKVYAKFSILRSGVWGMEQSAEIELQQNQHYTVLGYKLLMGSKVYMMSSAGRIVVLDLVAPSFFIVELPAEEGCSRSLKFSRAQRSGLYLIDATGLQLRVWHGDGVGQWALVDTISVCEACNHFNVQRWEPDDGQSVPVSVVAVSDNAEFVILKLVASEIVCCMQLGNRVVDKVDEGVLRNYDASVYPIAMVWPPIFPVFD
ncbi:hypothetical protein ACP70R_042271 [Stipagrostis hirtigluma subsp. patula]